MNVRKIFKIEGMTCHHCENTIEDALKKKKGIIQVEAHHAKKMARIEYDQSVISETEIKLVIREAGYEAGAVSEDTGPSRKAVEIAQVVGISLALLGAYFLIQKTIGFNFIPQVNSSMGLGMIFIVGLITSLHCVAMCGGISISQYTQGVDKGGNKYINGILYNTGRVVAYTILGGIIGAVGSVFNFSPAIKGGITLGAGILMIFVGLRMAGVFAFLKKVKLPGSGILSKFAPKKSDVGKKRSYGPFIVGLLNGLMPCAPLQAMQLYAPGTGSALAGALSMLFFSIGTVPLMFGLGTAASLLSRKFSGSLIRISALIVMFLGLVMVNRGLALSGNGVVLTSAQANVAAVKGDYQEVTMVVSPNGYEPIVVQRGIPVKWIIKADSQSLNGCNNGILAPQFNITKKLAPGDNIVEFTPDTSGKFGYSCWMGMIRSTITVVDDVTKVDPNSIKTNDQSVPQNYAGGCCRSGTGRPLMESDIYVPPVVNNVQQVTINVDQNGYSPAIIVIQKGAAFKVKFSAKQLTSCNSGVYFPEYGGGLDFTKGQLETPLLKASKDFHFTCWMGMIKGFGAVVGDVNNFNKADLIARANLPGPGGARGGCCGR